MFGKMYFKLILTILIVGSFTSQGHWEGPNGRVYWKWFDKELGVYENGRCIWNDGEPRECNLTELSKMLSIME